MQQSTFLKFDKVVKGPLVMRKVDEDANKFNWHNVS